MIPNVSRIRHSFSGCPCGHLEHTGRGLRDGVTVRCAQCDALEAAAGDGHVVTVETIARLEALALGEGAVVRCDGQTCLVVALEEITRLGGSYSTGYVRLTVREVRAEARTA